MVSESGDLCSPIRLRAKKDCEWKSAESYAPDAALVYQFPGLGSFVSQLRNPLKLRDERGAKSGATPFVKADGLQVLRFSLRKKAVL